MKFKNPANGYVESIDSPGLWCLLFGSFYFAFKGVWGWAIISLVLASCTAGISWFILPFFAGEMIQKHFQRKGWIEESPQIAAEPQKKGRSPKQEADHQRKLAEAKAKMGW